MKTIITRADDAGSSLSANAAIERVIAGGYVKNVSILAAGAFVEDAARRFFREKRVCFGLHAAINAEWDAMRWSPVREDLTSLKDASGFFYQDPALFVSNPPPVEDILKEYGAQLDKLTRAGFTLSYVDSHMLPERVIPGLHEAMGQWIKSKGLIDHSAFYRPLPGMDEIAHRPGAFEETLAALPEGQYFAVLHPSLDTPEMRSCGNARVDGPLLARSRQEDTDFAADPGTLAICLRFGFTPIRYDQAVPGEPRIWR